jgi:hypothetical protein
MDLLLAFRPHLTMGLAFAPKYSNAPLLGAFDRVVFQKALYLFLMIFIELFNLETTASFCDAHPICRLIFAHIDIKGCPAQYVSEMARSVRAKNIRRYYRCRLNARDVFVTADKPG